MTTILLNADNTAPAVSAALITPSNTVNFTQGPCRSIYVGGAGNINAVMADGTTVLFSNNLAGSVLPVSAIRVNVTSTTATLMVAMF